MGDAEGSGMVGCGMGVVSMGESALKGLRFSMVFSKVSSFCSTVEEDNFSLSEIISVAMT